MALEMVDRDQGLPAAERQRLAGHQADHDATDQPRPGGGGDRVDIGQRDAGIGQRASISGISASTWARAAISGTTPP
jgi:hypothetical protein